MKIKREMRPIRASEIGTYLFCQRAWWYQTQGIASENLAEMNAGTHYHHQHADQVWTFRITKFAAWLLLLAGIILLSVALTLRWLN
jgi:CRISPR/Cas system-associated exonuclease Cas4 (RecB family)